MIVMRTGIGIELSGDDLRVAVIRQSLGRLRLERSFTVPGFWGLSKEDQKTALSKLVANGKIPTSRIFLNLSKDHGVLRTLEFPVEIREKVRAALELQLESLSPWPVEEIYWNFSLEPAKSGAKLFNVHVAIIPRATVDPWIEFFKSTKLPLSGVSLSSLVSAHGVAALWPGPGATIVLTCERDYVEGCLVRGNRLSSAAATGANTGIVAKGIIERLVSSGRISSVESVRLIGTGSSAAALEAVEAVQLPLENAGAAPRNGFGAIAAALLGLKTTGFELNLMPESLRYRQNQLQLIPTYFLIGITLLLGLVLAAREPYQQAAYSSDLGKEIQKLAPEAKEVSAQEAELNGFSEKYRTLDNYFKSRDLNLEALRELARVLPSSAFLSNYSYQDGSIALSGFAGSATEVQKALEDSPWFKDVQFTSSLTRDTTGKDRFTLKASMEIQK